MGLKTIVQNLRPKKTEPQSDPELLKKEEGRLIPEKDTGSSAEKRIAQNMQKAMNVAVEIEVLRSRLPELMAYSSAERIRKMDDELEKIEIGLKGPKAAAADLGKADEIAVNVFREFSSLLSDPSKESETEEALDQIREALLHDWFSNENDSPRRTRRRLSSVLIRENIAILDDQISGLKEWARKDAAELKNLMSSLNDSSDHNAEVVRLSNNLKKHKLSIAGKESVKTELATLQDALDYTLLYSTNTGAFQLLREEGNEAETEQNAEIQNAVKEKEKITQKLISNKVRTDMMGEKMAAMGIALPDMEDLHELISEFDVTEEMLLNAEPVNMAEAANKENKETDNLMA